MMNIHTTQNKKLLLGIPFVFFMGLFINSNIALAEAIPCVPMPDVSVLGSGTNISGACTAMNSTLAAGAALDTQATQAASYAMQAEQYAQQVLAAQNLIIQTEMMIRALQENPLEVIVPDANQLIANQERINKLAQEIDKNSSSVSKNLIRNLDHPNTVGLGQGSKFQLWSEAREAAAKESYEKVIGFTKEQKKKNKAVSQAIKNIDHAQAQDSTAVAKATANAAGQQLAMLQEIKELLTQLLGIQAVENGAKLQAENDSAAAQASALANGFGPRIIIPHDTYKGPGTSNSKGF